MLPSLQKREKDIVGSWVPACPVYPSTGLYPFGAREDDRVIGYPPPLKGEGQGGGERAGVNGGAKPAETFSLMEP
ncbi:MAG: hypothetical protein AVO39_06135, partial [delta proteobacterium MLS_D]